LERLEIKHLKNKIRKLETQIYNLQNPEKYSDSYVKNHKLNQILQDADDAMDRFNTKLRKENVKYAKQKQNKG
jgi:hypothetical protein